MGRVARADGACYNKKAIPATEANSMPKGSGKKRARLTAILIAVAFAFTVFIFAFESIKSFDFIVMSLFPIILGILFLSSFFSKTSFNFVFDTIFIFVSLFMFGILILLLLLILSKFALIFLISCFFLNNFAIL